MLSLVNEDGAYIVFDYTAVNVLKASKLQSEYNQPISTSSVAGNYSKRTLLLMTQKR